MIIFDLDTLANCEHRRHFIDPSKRDDTVLWMSNTTKETWVYREGWNNHETRNKFIPDWKLFYESCDKDKPIDPVIDIFREYNDDEYNTREIQIWSGRCESVRVKTEIWLRKHTSFGRMNCRVLKMRPIGDYTPDDELKERWLDELIQDSIGKFMLKEKEYHKGVNEIEFVFDSDPKSIEMFRRRGIFVFDCNQNIN